MTVNNKKRTFSIRKTLMKLYVRIMAQKGSPDFVARGVAIGLFIGLLIPMSGQLIIAIPLAYLLHGSKLAASAATFITNPWTVVVIYPIQIYFGKMLLTLKMPDTQEIHQIYEAFMDAMSKVSFTSPSSFGQILDLGVQELILPFFAAGAVMGIVGAAIGYFLTLRLVVRYRKLRQDRKIKKSYRREAERIAALKQR